MALGALGHDPENPVCVPTLSLISLETGRLQAAPWANLGVFQPCQHHSQRGFGLRSSSHVGSSRQHSDMLSPQGHAVCPTKPGCVGGGEKGALRGAVCQGETANLIAELKGFAPTAQSGLRAMSGRAFVVLTCPCPSCSEK